MIEHVTETDSTNRQLADRAATGASEGLWIRADRQTQGKGRQGRKWHSPVGNLYASTLVRLRPDDPPAPTLALVAGIAAFEALKLTAPQGTPFAIKWPNDLLLNADGNWAKLAGILLERHGDAVIVGIGVNLVDAPAIPGRATAALTDVAPAPDLAYFCETLADLFTQELAIWRNRGLCDTRSRWLERALPPGSPLRVHGEGGKSHDGLFESLAGDGALILRLADGSRMTVSAGDVDLLSES